MVVSALTMVETVFQSPELISEMCSCHRQVPTHCTVVDGATGAPEEEVQENSARVGFFRLLLLEISTADIFEVYTEKMNFPGGLVSENLQFY